MSAPLTIDELERILDDIHSAMTDRPKDGEPLVLSDDEVKRFQETGILFKHWKGGELSLIVSEKKRSWLRELLSR